MNKKLKDEKLIAMLNQGFKDSEIGQQLSSYLDKSEVELLNFLIVSKNPFLIVSKNPGGLFHCRSVLSIYKTLSNIYGLENK